MSFSALLKSFGNYPKEYNKAIHGPYYPFVNYGKQDTPLKDVKIGELAEWIKRRDLTPKGFMATSSRITWLWLYKWREPRYASPSIGFFQIMVVFCSISFVGMWDFLKHERRHKYHW